MSNYSETLTVKVDDVPEMNSTLKNRRKLYDKIFYRVCQATIIFCITDLVCFSFSYC